METTPTADGSLPPIRPHERSLQLEVDAFCQECGYNLHGQAVTRDERLGIYVCRCPECGRYHPAGIGVSATADWLRRLASGLLFMWVIIVLIALFWICIGMGAVIVAHVETFTFRKLIASDGRDAEWKQITVAGGGTSYQPVLKGTTQPIAQWTMAYTLEPQDQQLPWYRNPAGGWIEFSLLALGGAALGFVSALLMVIFLWHWKKRRYLMATLLPVAVAAVVITIFVADDDFKLIIPWAIQVAAGYAVWMSVWMGIGILIGRPIARILLRMFVPPKPRQHFAFLWTIDGKTPPPPKLV